MVTEIKKRSGKVVEFDENKIVEAIHGAGKDTGEFGKEESKLLAKQVVKSIETDCTTVEDVQDAVELVLLNSEYKQTAKAYILYREQQFQARKPNIFKERVNLKPYEYPHLDKYKEAIQHSYWLFSEFSYSSDIQDFNTNVTEEERNVIKNAINQSISIETIATLVNLSIDEVKNIIKEHNLDKLSE